MKSIEVSDAIYNMDWTILRVRVMRDLIIIMRASKPVKMSSGYVVTLTTESFMSVSMRKMKQNQITKYIHKAI